MSYIAKRNEQGDIVEPFAVMRFGSGLHAATQVFRWYDGDIDQFTTEEGVRVARITEIFWARSARHAREIWRNHLLPD